jgi:hypothetical protein
MVFGFYNYLTFGTPNNCNDFYFHFQKSAGIYEGETAEYYLKSFYDNYPPMFHFYARWFASNTYFFYVGACLLVLLFIPTFLYWASKNNIWVTILYFCSVGLPHQLIYNSTFAQAMLLLLLSVYLFFRDSKYRIYAWIGLAFLSVFTHKQGGLSLFMGVGLLEILIFLAQKWDLKKSSAFVVLGGVTLDGGRLVSLFFLQSNIWVSWLALNGIIRLKEVFYFGLMIAGIVFSKIDIRVFALFQIGLILVASKEIKLMKDKRLLILILCLHLLFLLFEYLNKTLLVLQL